MSAQHLRGGVSLQAEIEQFTTNTTSASVAVWWKSRKWLNTAPVESPTTRSDAERFQMLDVALLVQAPHSL